MSQTLRTAPLLTSPAQRVCDTCNQVIDAGDAHSWDAATATIMCAGCTESICAAPTLIVPVRPARRRQRTPLTPPASCREPDRVSIQPPSTQPFAPPVGLPAATIAPPAAIERAAPIAPVVQPDDVDLRASGNDLLDALVGAATEAAESATPDTLGHTEQRHTATLHDRKIARTREVIDRIIVTPMGVLVVDDRSPSQSIEIVEAKRGLRVLVDGKDATKSFRRMGVAQQAVEGALALLGKGALAVQRVVHHPGAGGSVSWDDVLIVDDAGLQGLMETGGTLSDHSIDVLAEQLGDRFVAR